jgi:hypothetical protein
MEKKKGLYLGTEINEKWFRRYTRDNLFTRGNGEYWLDEQGLYFLRYLTSAPVVFLFNMIKEVKIGSWHCGKWCLGGSIVKIVWEKDGLRLSSGFLVPGAKEAALNLKQVLESKIRR